MRPNEGYRNQFMKEMEAGNAIWGAASYTLEEFAAIQANLTKQLGPEYVSSRPGPGGGGKVIYLEGWKAMNLANDIFGFNGWSSSIINITVDFVDCNQETGRFSIGVAVTCRVTLKDGTYHEDIGYGSCENMKSKAGAFEKAKKEAATDALKRALRMFGNVMGNCMYDKKYGQEIVKVKVPPIKFAVDNLYRKPEFASKETPISGPSMTINNTKSDENRYLDQRTDLKQKEDYNIGKSTQSIDQKTVSNSAHQFQNSVNNDTVIKKVAENYSVKSTQNSDNFPLAPSRLTSPEDIEVQLSPSAIKAQYDALDSQYAHLFSEFDDLSPQIDSVFFIEHEDESDRFKDASVGQINNSPCPTRDTQSHQFSSLNQILQVEQNNLSFNKLEEKNKTYEHQEHQALQFDSVNDNHESNKRSFLKNNASFDSDSKWNTLSNERRDIQQIKTFQLVESSRKSQRIDNSNNFRNSDYDNFNNNEVSLGANTLGNSRQIAGIKRFADSMSSTGLSSG
ncbi:5641_t:CDS:2, partial [Funneliformis mosseae]